MADVIAPEPVTVTRYRCPFCHRSGSAKKAVSEHIARCWLNPAAKACKTCVHFADEPDGDYCNGRPCGCNQGFQHCEAGIRDVADGRIVSGCPLWQARGGATA